MSLQTRTKTYELKDAIHQLYCIEGKSLNYISKLFSLNRKTMSDIINNEFKFTRNTNRQATPRIRKLININKPTILMMCNQPDCIITDILEETGLKRHELRTIRIHDSEIDNSIKTITERESIASIKRKQRIEREKKFSYTMQSLPNEEWKPVVGYETRYWVSNFGRLKSSNQVMTPQYNKRLGRYQYTLWNGKSYKTFKRYRLIAIAFIDNPNNLPTVNHIDGDYTNDVRSNLEWASYSEQNDHKNLVLHRPIAKKYGKNGKFKFVVLNNKYQFKTIRACSKFLGISETQCQRYISGETLFDGKIELKY